MRGFELIVWEVGGEGKNVTSHFASVTGVSIREQMDLPAPKLTLQTHLRVFPSSNRVLPWCQSQEVH